MPGDLPKVETRFQKSQSCKGKPKEKDNKQFNKKRKQNKKTLNKNLNSETMN